MQLPRIANGVPPGEDGAVTRYISPEVQNKSWFNASSPVIFVNGMMNKPLDHKESAEALSLMLGRPVIGVYNKSVNGLVDFLQCVTDKLTLTEGQTRSASANQSAIDLFETLFKLQKARNPMVTKETLALDLLKGNTAAQSLFALLAAPSGVLGMPIYCHSQGNLITSNALTAVTMVRGAQSVNGLEVNSFGSPARGWPSGLNRTNNAYTFDPVSFLDLTMDLTSSKVGFKVAHGFLNYVAQDGEFVINRFRTGGWGVTFNMDEKGLAKFCVKQGTNTRRLRTIFDRLEAAHYTDSDDVAVEYVNLLSDTEIAQLQQTDPNFIRQLIRLLNAGYTASDEKAAIKRLEAAQALV